MVSISLGRPPLLGWPLVSPCVPTLVAWNGCLQSLWLCEAFKKLSVPFWSPPVIFLRPLSGRGGCPCEPPADPPLLVAALLEVVFAESPGPQSPGLAVGRLVAVLAGVQESR